MDPSFFKVLWIERLLSTFDPHSSLLQEENVVAQVLSIKAVSYDINGLTIGWQGEVHDNQLFVNVVFTKDAVKKFIEEEEQDGCSGAEFHEIKNSIITIKKYQILPRLCADQAKSDMLVCIDYFTLSCFDAIPRLSGPPLGFACQKQTIAANMHKIWRLNDEQQPEPAETSHTPDTNNESEPHLTQLLNAIDKAALKETKKKQRSFVFEVEIPQLPPSDTSSTTTTTSESESENIHILYKVLNEIEKKLALAKALHHHVAENSIGGQRSSLVCDSQVLHNSPTFRIAELPHDFQRSSQGIVADFDESDYEVPHEVLKQLQTIEEWRPGYHPPASSADGASLDLHDMAGGGLSSSMEVGLGVAASSTRASDTRHDTRKAEDTEEQRPDPSGVQKVEERGKKRGTRPSADTDHDSRDGDLLEAVVKETDLMKNSNEKTHDSQKLSQPESEAMSLGSSDWDLASVESIGLSTEELLLAVSHGAGDAQTNQEKAAQLVNSPLKREAAPASDKQDKAPNKHCSPAHANKRKRQLPSEESVNKIPRQNSPDKDPGDSENDSNGSVNISTGFDTSELYKSPSPRRVSGSKPRRVIANLRSPQIPLSIPTPINSLPSHQPRRSSSGVQRSSARSCRPTSQGSTKEMPTSQPSVDDDDEIKRLSSIQLEDEVLQWCTKYWITIATEDKERTAQARRGDRRS